MTCGRWAAGSMSASTRRDWMDRALAAAHHRSRLVMPTTLSAALSEHDARMFATACPAHRQGFRGPTAADPTKNPERT